MYGDLPKIKLPGTDTVVNAYPIELQNPAKLCIVRLPTADELTTYLAAQRSNYRDLGRRQGENEEVASPKADLALFEAIRLDKLQDDGSPALPWDESEALYAIGIVTRHLVEKCERVGQQYEVTIKTIFGETVHTVNIPFQKDIAEYRRNVMKVRSLPHNLEEHRFPPDVPSKLYDKVLNSASGYTVDTPVPPHHKRSVVGELLSALAALDPNIDPNY